MPLLPADFTQPSLQTILRINLDGTFFLYHFVEVGEEVTAADQIARDGYAYVKKYPPTIHREIFFHVYVLTNGSSRGRRWPRTSFH